MAEEQSAANYCEVCGIDVDSNTKLKRFGKLFCNEEHLNQYIKARQRKMGLDEGEIREERREPRRRWGGC
ncbi:hypothetical protein [Nitrososphaera sp.]|uniref:hypothetical protein n=1 Tax=Nitrososphaera sp. TaxID=1971748 RepID=UPI00307EB1C2